MDKSEIINRLIKENNCDSYLELGYQEGLNFNKIECGIKTSVDINGKAHFNDGDLEFFKGNEINYDVVFIDSNHEASHVRMVIIEALKMSPKLIILHDSLPREKNQQIEPRMQKVYCGTVWRAVVGFHESYPDVRLETYRSDYGLSVLYPEGKKVRKNFENTQMTYGEFKADEVNLLNIID